MARTEARVRAPRGEYAKTAARRQEILAAAVQVFSEAGFRKGSLRDVADRVGLSQAGLLHHYPSKNHLLEAVLQWRDERTSEHLGPEQPTGVTLLLAMVDVARENTETPGLIELHVTLSAEATTPDHPVHDYFVQRYEMVRGLFCGAFEEAAAQGALRPGLDPASCGRSLVALMDGLQVQWLLDRSSVDMPEEIRRYLQAVLTVDA